MEWVQIQFEDADRGTRGCFGLVVVSRPIAASAIASLGIVGELALRT